MRSFHEWPLLLQWVVALALACGAATLIGLGAWGSAVLLGLRVESPPQLGLALVVVLVLCLPVWLLVCGVLMAPLLRLAGVLRYYSPFLVVSRADRGRLVLHGAMLFDYLLLFRWCDRGRPAVRRILLWYVDGLVSLAREVEQGLIPGATEISATSYIFSGHSLRRLGFRVESASRFAWGGRVTYPIQFLTYSFARGRWSRPPIRLACKATIKASQLCARMGQLQRVQKRLRFAIRQAK